MHTIQRTAAARSPKARNRRFVAGMAMLFVMLMLYCTWPPRMAKAGRLPVRLGVRR